METIGRSRKVLAQNGREEQGEIRGAGSEVLKRQDKLCYNQCMIMSGLMGLWLT